MPETSVDSRSLSKLYSFQKHLVCNRASGLSSGSFGLIPGLLLLLVPVAWVEGMTVWCNQGDQPPGLARISASSLDMESHVFKWTLKPKAKSRVSGNHDATSDQMF